MTTEEIKEDEEDFTCEACGEEIENYFERYCEHCKLEILNNK